MGSYANDGFHHAKLVLLLGGLLSNVVTWQNYDESHEKSIKAPKILKIGVYGLIHPELV